MILFKVIIIIISDDQDVLQNFFSFLNAIEYDYCWIVNVKHILFNIMRFTYILKKRKIKEG